MNSYVKSRSAEMSSWLGILLVGMSAFLGISPEQASEILAIVGALAGALGIVLPDKRS